MDGSDQSLGDWTGPAPRDLKELYAQADYLPLWSDGMGTVTRSAGAALALLRAASNDGLQPDDYRSGQLDRQRAAIRWEVTAAGAQLARFDVALTLNTLRYFHHLQSGRVDPRTVGFLVETPAERPEFAERLRSAVADHRLRETAAALRPPFAQYDALRGVLSRYQLLALPPDSARGELPPFTGALHPGDSYAGIGALRLRLTAMGDLPAGTPVDAGTTGYEGPVVEAVKRFQVRHGLASDGIIGKSTQAALLVPFTQRVRQIEWALERLRWLPRLHDARVVAINIPMFRLWAWDAVASDGQPSFGTNVIVGRALRTPTPVFMAQLREVVFRPYWNVPSSILHHEILSILERDPSYLRRENMEIVRGSGDDARIVPVSSESLVLLRRGSLRLRQRPGPRNALGLIKFVFPNASNVYMHGTPARTLFNQSRRDFSHGCVRLEDPAALAEWALKEQPDWTRAAIVAAMSGTRSLRVPLSKPIQVLLLYSTAGVMPEDGLLHFAEDIYLHDAKLDLALTRREQTPRTFP